MKTFSKLLVASALVASFAAPALASAVGSEGMLLAERNVYTNPPSANGWSNAYAMETPKQAGGAYWSYDTLRDFGNSSY